jgi:hypothetical protein
MLSLFRRFALCVLALLFSLPSTAQDLAARLQQVTDLTDIGSINSKPWYLKMDVTTYDNYGKNPQVGTVEVKSSGNDRLTIITFGSAKERELISGGHRYLSSEGVVPYYAEVALDRILHIGPHADDLRDAQYVLQTESLSKVSFDCIVLEHAMKTPAVVRSGVFPAYCLQHDNGMLRIAYDYGMEKTIVNGMAKFLDHIAPTALSITELGQNAAEAKVTAMGTFVPAAADFNPTAYDREVPLHRPQVGPSTGGLKVLDRGNVRMAMDTRTRQAHGTVVMHVVVSRDGYVHSVRPVTFPDPDLVAVAMLTVHQWRFTPYKVNDVPTDAETNISYTFGGGNVDVLGIRH